MENRWRHPPLACYFVFVAESRFGSSIEVIESAIGVYPCIATIRYSTELIVYELFKSKPSHWSDKCK